MNENWKAASKKVRHWFARIDEDTLWVFLLFSSVVVTLGQCIVVFDRNILGWIIFILGGVLVCVWGALMLLHILFGT